QLSVGASEVGTYKAPDGLASGAYYSGLCWMQGPVQATRLTARATARAATPYPHAANSGFTCCSRFRMVAHRDHLCYTPDHECGENQAPLKQQAQSVYAWVTHLWRIVTGRMINYAFSVFYNADPAGC